MCRTCPARDSRFACSGCRHDALYSLAEIGRRHALRVSVLSLADTLRFGLCADPTLLPGVEHLAEAIEDEADALVRLAG